MPSLETEEEVILELNEWVKSKLKIKRWSPILFFIPIVLAIFEIVCMLLLFVLTPLIKIIPIIKWLFGFWKCYYCKKSYGIKTDRVLFDGENVCEYCVIAKKLIGGE